MSDQTPAYIAKCKCGCGANVFAAVDVPDMAKSNAKEIARLIRQGYHVERSTVGAARSGMFMCQKEKAARADLFSTPDEAGAVKE